MTALDEDFETLKQSLKSRFGIQISSNLNPYLLRLHSKIYSTFLLRHSLEAQNIPRLDYLNEICSDSIQIIPISTMGFTKPFYLLTREIIEGTLNHVYYQDHPVEYELRETELKGYPDIETLFKYSTRHPIYRDNRNLVEKINRIKDLHAETSRYIHSSNKSFSSPKRNLDAVKISEQELIRLVDLVLETLDISLLLLLLFHAENMKTFNVDHKILMLSSLERPTKRIYHKIT